MSRDLKAWQAMQERPCHDSSLERSPDHVTEPLEFVDSLPDNWSWDNVNGTNFLTVIHNQHVPQYCGSCWAQAVSSSLSDRIKIARKGAFPDINIAPQVFVSCANNTNGCNGGMPVNAYAWAHENYLTDETCSIYHGRDGSNGYGCSPVTMCRNCNPHEPCFIPDEYYVYKVGDYGSVKGEEEMMQHIFQNGPIACEIAVPEDFYLNYTGGIYEDKTGDLNPVHDISVVGWGVSEDGVKYWVGRNSWGESWGENGFFKVVRGVNNIAIESDCAYAIPIDTWTEGETHKTTDEERNDPRNDYSNGPYPGGFEENEEKEDKPCRLPNEWYGDQETNVPEEVLNMKDEDLPESVDWRNYNGTNYLSWSKNQHIPVYCGSCWSQGTTSALADRFNILNWLTNGETDAPQVALSAQAIVNCEAGGSCNGGQPASVYRFAKSHGIPHASCEQYIAHNIDKSSDVCSDFNVCRDCSGPPPAANDTGFDHCWAIDYKKYHVSGYRSVSGATNMKKELATYGPIGCGISVTDKFEDYKGGIYEENKWFPMINHEISVVGYGVEDGTEYWIGRNSWGTYWGEYGFFRIKMHKHNLAIESDCVAGYPTYDAQLPHEETQ
jgi:cathepsin X